mmetsp:Transcript_39857/g.93442  ORF Transcript_39857/g.93442 Transcript_39857/m.93442 type:complete len:198 (-) Transcript_39857:487-1080(-)|eukprot:CAMPEP_0113304324 /NCGR_PEP_ID=MMETSP0010_2-20120614/4394_1 /TAXON_ID=216773 ORGANISM="Corethron hystrix, Strain 308" /NCGR_SAMPLE_ID=MMETSP0010_2 /ASSEMBLY_ACC=CAM_ASM_000155 /LENGTH=197 /DNA_ID=CAMNT_0000158515 /DNA_START=203 /DNA_END=796 /DNA_ORIENTATION=- /assembly_acc=CAM_ASM_000155
MTFSRTYSRTLILLRFFALRSVFGGTKDPMRPSLARRGLRFGGGWRQPDRLAFLSGVPLSSRRAQDVRAPFGPSHFSRPIRPLSETAVGTSPPPTGAPPSDAEAYLSALNLVVEIVESKRQKAMSPAKTADWEFAVRWCRLTDPAERTPLDSRIRSVLAGHEDEDGEEVLIVVLQMREIFQNHIYLMGAHPTTSFPF